MKHSLDPDNDRQNTPMRHEFNMHPDHKPRVVFEDPALQHGYDSGRKRVPYDWDAGEPFDDLPPREPNHYVPVDSLMRAFHRGMIAGAVIEAVLIIAGIALFYALF